MSHRNKLLVAFQIWFETDNLRRFRNDQEVEGITNFGANLKIAFPASVSNGANFLHELARKRLLCRVTRGEGLLIKLSIRIWALQPVSKLAPRLFSLAIGHGNLTLRELTCEQKLHFRLPPHLRSWRYCVGAIKVLAAEPWSKKRSGDADNNRWQIILYKQKFYSYSLWLQYSK